MQTQDQLKQATTDSASQPAHGPAEEIGSGQVENDAGSTIHTFKVKAEGGVGLVAMKSILQTTKDKFQIRWSGKFRENPRFMSDQPWANMNVFILWDKIRVFVALLNVINLAISSHMPDYKYQLGGIVGSSSQEQKSADEAITSWIGFGMQAVQWVEAVTLFSLVFTLRKKLRTHCPSFVS